MTDLGQKVVKTLNQRFEFYILSFNFKLKVTYRFFFKEEMILKEIKEGRSMKFLPPYLSNGIWTLSY